MKKINKEDRIGEKTLNYQGLEMIIIDWTNSCNIVVDFTGDYKDRRVTTYSHFKDGQVKNRYLPTVHGIGWIGDEKINTKNDEIAYDTWRNMIRRCYDKKYKKEKVQSYDGCSVDKCWFSYPNFKKWFDENYYNIENEVMNLDKDILIKGNKIYSPSTCVFVPSKINSLFTYEKLNKNGLPHGVSKTIKNSKNKYRVRLHIDNIEVHIGNRNTKEEAFILYKNAKEYNIKRMANKYKEHIPQKLYDRLIEYEVEYEN